MDELMCLVKVGLIREKTQNPLIMKALNLGRCLPNGVISERFELEMWRVYFQRRRLKAQWVE